LIGAALWRVLPEKSVDTDLRLCEPRAVPGIEEAKSRMSTQRLGKRSIARLSEHLQAAEQVKELPWDITRTALVYSH
jgi:hypothetical protein